MNFKSIKSIGSIGCMEAYPSVENRNIQLTNYCCLIGILSILTFNTSRIFEDFHKALFPIIVVTLYSLILVFGIYLNSKKYHLTASILANLTFTLAVFTSTGIFLGKLPGVHYYFLLFAIVPTITISLKKFHFILILVALNLFCFTYVEYIKSPDSILIYFTPKTNTIYRIASIITSFSTIILIIWANQTILNKNEDKLKKQSDDLLNLNAELTEQYAIIKQQTQRIEDHNNHLKKLNIELSALNATRDKFFSIIAHDLRHPFGIIQGYSEILIEKVKDNQTSHIDECAKHIHTTSRQTCELLENLLKWASSQNGTMPFNPEAIDLKQILDEEAGKLRDFAGQKSIEVQNILTESIDIDADINMVNSILRNLITNSVKFTPKGGLIELNAIKTKQFAEISVKDNGVGIPVHVKDILFSSDINISALGTNHERGMGLGLVLCKEFIEKHGGEIWLKSEPGHGSEFKFTIPLAIKGANKPIKKSDLIPSISKS